VIFVILAYLKKFYFKFFKKWIIKCWKDMKAQYLQYLRIKFLIFLKF